jgi:hypothetical protein
MSEQSEKKESNDVQEISAETPVGKLAAKGVRLSDTISLVSLLVVVWSGSMMYFHMQQTAEANQNIATALNKLSDNLVSNNRQTKKLTCILSAPPERREAEYNLPYSQCNQVGQ